MCGIAIFARPFLIVRWPTYRRVPCSLITRILECYLLIQDPILHERFSHRKSHDVIFLFECAPCKNARPALCDRSVEPLKTILSLLSDRIQRFINVDITSHNVES